MIVPDLCLLVLTLMRYDFHSFSHTRPPPKRGFNSIRRELNDLLDTVNVALGTLSKYETAQNARFFVLLSIGSCVFLFFFVFVVVVFYL